MSGRAEHDAERHIQYLFGCKGSLVINVVMCSARRHFLHNPMPRKVGAEIRPLGLFCLGIPGKSLREKVVGQTLAWYAVPSDLLTDTT